MYAATLEGSMTFDVTALLAATVHHALPSVPLMTEAEVAADPALKVDAAGGVWRHDGEHWVRQGQILAVVSTEASE